MGKHKTMKKGESKALSISHPNSRKAKSLAKKMIKSSAREKTKMNSLIRRTLLVNNKLMWFKENLENCNECTASLLDSLFQKYLKRFDDELAQIRLKHSIGQRKNRQHASREDVILMTQKREIEEYNTCGIEMVDILQQKEWKKFKEWDGNPSVQFKIRRFSRNFLAKYQPSSDRTRSRPVSESLADSEPSQMEESMENENEAKEIETVYSCDSERKSKETDSPKENQQDMNSSNNKGSDTMTVET